MATSQDSCEIAATAARGPRGCGPSEPVGRPRLPVARAGPSATTLDPTRRATIPVASPLEIPSSRASRARVIPGSAWTARSTPIAVEDRTGASRADAVKGSMVLLLCHRVYISRTPAGAGVRPWHSRDIRVSRRLRLGRSRLLFSRIAQRQAKPAFAGLRASAPEWTQPRDGSGRGLWDTLRPARGRLTSWLRSAPLSQADDAGQRVVGLRRGGQPVLRPPGTTPIAGVHHAQCDGCLDRPGLVGDSWPWKIKDKVHASRSHSWEADDASVFAGGEAGGGEDGPVAAGGDRDDAWGGPKGR